MTAATALRDCRVSPDAEVSVDVPQVHHVVARDYRLVWRFLRHLGIAAHDVDDAAQTVFARVLSRQDVVQAGLERAYLMKAALHICFEYRRALRRTSDRSVDVELERFSDPGMPPDEAMARREQRALLDAALDQLPIELRAALTLFELEELSFTEIAQVLEVPRGTVASRVRRARELFTLAAQRLQRRGAQ